ncbi:hypothetical protein FB45DRAFT_114935 [Roridomyces roridus]|uniref:Uncharacterized protein n=1 Tax=Roridomyces roridus TaxID=1738132 RepID=A0AAD7FJK1_9AGAR|nr:hypothetical protein FB45DRAFT_114935 [Roridomyces roridus]
MLRALRNSMLSSDTSNVCVNELSASLREKLVRSRTRRCVYAPMQTQARAPFSTQLLDAYNSIVAVDSTLFHAELGESITVILAISLFTTDLPYDVVRQTTESIDGVHADNLSGTDWRVAMRKLARVYDRLSAYGTDLGTIITQVAAKKTKPLPVSTGFSLVSIVNNLATSVIGLVLPSALAVTTGVRGIVTGAQDTASLLTKSKEAPYAEESNNKAKLLSALRILSENLRILLRTLHLLHRHLVLVRMKPAATLTNEEARTTKKCCESVMSLFYVDASVFGSMDTDTLSSKYGDIICRDSPLMLRMNYIA